MGLKEIIDTVAGLANKMSADDETKQNAPGGNGGTIRIQYYKSFIGAPQKQRQAVRSLGITKLNQTVERPDTPATRGAVAKVPHLLRIVE